MSAPRDVVLRSVVFALLLLPLAAAGGDEFAAVEALWGKGEYNRAIEEILNPSIARLESLMVQRDLTPDELATFQQASLLLVHTRALYHDQFRRQRDSDPAKQQINAAKLDIDRLLSMKALRHTHPDSTHELVLTLFEEVRKQKFGNLKVYRLDPPNATVVFQSDTLRVASGEQYPSETDILPGTYNVLVRCAGYRDLRETVQVKRGDTTTPTFQLRKGRNWWWWTWRGGVVAGAATAVTLALTGGEETTTAPLADLPEPPGPPTR